MDIVTLSDVTRLDRVFHNVVNLINKASLPNLGLRETRKFSITGGTIKSIVDDGERTVSLVDEMRYSEAFEKFVPSDTITVYASKHENGEIKPVKMWELDPEATNEIAFVVAYFFLGHNHLINRHFGSEMLRQQLQIPEYRFHELMK